MTTRTLQFVELSDEDRKEVGCFSKIGKGDKVEMRVKRRTGPDQTLSLPPDAAALIEALLGHLLEGDRVAVLTEDQELSPNDAAGILGVSRPHVVHRMEIGELPFRYVGKHRRARLKDVLGLKSKLDAQRAAMEALADDSEDLSNATVLDPSVAIFDACVLYPFHLRNIVVQIAVHRLVDARWTDEIHDEWIRNLVADVPGIPIERLQITRKLMNDALPDATVTEYQAHLEAVTLPDPDDRHVVAAAITADASVILTWNLRDFPTRELKKHGLIRQTPDVFLTDLYEKTPDLTVASLANARRNLSKRHVSASDFINILKNQKLTQLAASLKKQLTDL